MYKTFVDNVFQRYFFLHFYFSPSLGIFRAIRRAWWRTQSSFARQLPADRRRRKAIEGGGTWAVPGSLGTVRNPCLIPSHSSLLGRWPSICFLTLLTARWSCFLRGKTAALFLFPKSYSSVLASWYVSRIDIRKIYLFQVTNDLNDSLTYELEQ